MKSYFIIILLFISLRSMGQIDIRFDDGLGVNSKILLKALAGCYGKDRIIFWLDSLSYHGVFSVDLDSEGNFVNIKGYFSRNSSFGKDDLNKMREYLQKHKIKFNVVYANEFGKNEDSLRLHIRKELKQYFKKHKTKGIAVGFPGPLSPPWDKYLVDQGTVLGC